MFVALAYRSKWSNEWAKEWVYMKNDLNARTDVKSIIQIPIATSFGYKKPTCYINFEEQTIIVAFNVVCACIGTTNHVQDFFCF
jgi:hypothetical protein